MAITLNMQPFLLAISPLPAVAPLTLKGHVSRSFNISHCLRSQFTPEIVSQ